MTTRLRRPVLQATAALLTFVMLLQIFPVAAVNAAGIGPAGQGQQQGQGTGTGSDPGHEEVLLGDTSSLGYVPGELIVRMKDDAKGMSAQSQTAGRGVDGLALDGGPVDGFHLFTLPDGADMSEVLAILRQDPDVLYAEPNYIFSAQADPPNDPRFGEQWALDEVNALTGWAMAETILDGAEAAPITVAVIDTGVDYQHGDLRDRLATGGFDGYNAITGETGQVAAADDSSNSHGTRVAGIIAAEANNGLGIAGVAGGLPVSILPVKALDQNGYGTMLQVANAIRWAADHGARVINLSLGARLADFPATLSDAVRYAQDKGVLIVAAAGNDALQYGGNVQGFYPACLPGVLAASASTADKKLAAFSNAGDGVIGAPGVNVLSTIRDDGDGLDDDYAGSTGTSFAAPALSGIAAALLSVYPDRTASEVAAAIHSGSQDAGYWADSAYVSLKIADLHGALDATPDSDNYVTMLEPAEGAVLSGTVTLTAAVTDPDRVHHVEFLLRVRGDYESDPLLVRSVDGPLKTGLPVGSGVYSVQWDTTEEVGGQQIPDGQYWIEPRLYTSETVGDTYAGPAVTVLNNETGGLSIQVKKPRRGSADPENAAFASVLVAHATVNGSGVLTTELVWRGVTDSDGRLLVPRAIATHGNDYLVMVNGSDPGFFYMETLRSPGAYTLSADRAYKVSLSATTAEGTSLAGAAVLVDVLRGNIAGADDPEGRLTVPRKDQWDTGEDIFIAGHVNGQGIAEFYVSPGLYDFSIIDQDRMCFLLKRGVQISGDYSGSFGDAQDLAQVVLVPDPEAGFDEYDLAVSDGDRETVFLDPGSRVVTLSKDVYDLEIKATRRDIPVGYSYYDYFLNLSRTIDASSVASPLELRFGHISRATVAAISNGDPEADPPEHMQYAEGVIDYRFYDAYDNRATALYRKMEGSSWEEDLEFTLTFKDPGDATIRTSYFDFGYEARWDPPYNVAVGSICSVNLSLDTGGIMGAATATAFIKVIEWAWYPDEEPWSLKVDDVRDLNDQSMNVTYAALVCRDGSSYRKIAEQISDNPFLSFYIDQNLTADREYGIVIIGRTGKPFDPDTMENILAFYPLPSSFEFDPATSQPVEIGRVYLSDLPADGWERVVLECSGFNSLLVGDVVYSAYIKQDGAFAGGIIAESGDGSCAVWLPYGAEAVVQAARIGISLFSFDPYDDWWLVDDALTTPSILASKAIVVGGEEEDDGEEGDGEYDGTVILGDGELVKIVANYCVSEEPVADPGGEEEFNWEREWYDCTASSVIYGDLPEGPLVWGPIWVTPGTYHIHRMVPASSPVGYWTYLYDTVVTADAGQKDLDRVGGQLSAAIQLESGSASYPAGSTVRFTNQVVDEGGNRLVGMAAGHLGARDNAEGVEAGVSEAGASEAGDSGAGAQTHLDPAPFFVIRSAVTGDEVFRYKDPGSGLQGWEAAVKAGFQAGSWAPRLGSGTFTSGEWSIPEGFPAGDYLATLEIGAGPGTGDVESDPVSFTVGGAPGAPRLLTAGASPTNAANATISGDRALPGAMVTVYYYEEGDDPVEDRVLFGSSVAGEGGLFTVSGSLPPSDGTYLFYAVVTAGDLTGQPSATVEVVVDRTPTGAPANLDAEALQGGSIRLTWSVPDGSSASEIARFIVTRDGDEIGQVVPTGPGPWEFTDGLSQDDPLEPGVEYVYRVYAVDLAGNESQPAEKAATASGDADIEPPAVPGNLAVAFDVGGIARLSWDASVDNVAVQGYRIYMSAGAPPVEMPDEPLDAGIAHVDGQARYSYTVTGLSANTDYTFWVSAIDHVGTESAASDPITGKTPPMFITSFTAAVPRTKERDIKLGAELVFTVVGEPNRSVKVQTDRTTWLDSSGEMLAVPRDIADEVSLTEQVDGQSKGTGVYTGLWSVPSHTAVVKTIQAVISDGTPGPTRTLSGIQDTPVAASVAVNIALPPGSRPQDAALLDGGKILLWNDQANSGTVATVTGDGQHVLADVHPGEGYRLEVHSPFGQVLFAADNIDVPAGLVAPLPVQSPLPAAVSVRVVKAGAGGEPLADEPVEGVRVSATYLASASGLPAVEKMVSRVTDSNGYARTWDATNIVPFVNSGSTVSWSVSIPENLMPLYRPQTGTLTVEPGLNDLVIALAPVESTLVTGKVVDQRGDAYPLAAATVMATFVIDGYSFSVSTNTGIDGIFQIRVPKQRVTLFLGHRLGQQVYIPLELQEAGATYNHGTVTLRRDAVVVADINIRKAGSTEPIPLATMPGLSAMLNIDMENQRTREKWYGSGIDLPEIHVPYVESGDTVRFRVHGTNHGIGIVPAEFEVTIDDNLTGRASTPITLVEHGRITADVGTGSGAAVAGTSRTAVIYDGDGTNDAVLPRWEFSFSKMAFTSAALPQGTYTVIFYWTEVQGTSISSSASNRRLGFWDTAEAPPHAEYVVDVANGEITHLGAVSIPYTQTTGTMFFKGEGNSFTSSVSTAGPGTRVTHRLSYAYEKQTASANAPRELKLSAAIPGGAEYVAGTATLRAFRQVGGVTEAYEGDPEDAPTVQVGASSIVVDLGDDAAVYDRVEGVLTYQVTVPTNPSWPTMQANAVASFQYQPGGTYTVDGRESLGTILVDIPFISINAPGKTKGNVVNLTGTAAPNSVVRVYDGSWYLGKTVARSYGAWQMLDVQLPDRGTPGNHYLYATMGSDLEAETEDDVAVSKSVHVVTGTADPIPLTVTMYQEWNIDRAVTFYPALGVSTRGFTVLPGRAIWYEVRFDDPSRASDVRIVVKTGTSEEVLPAEYDSQKDAFVTYGFRMGPVFLRYNVLPRQYEKPDGPPDETDRAIILSGMPNAWRDAVWTYDAPGDGLGGAIFAQEDYVPSGTFPTVSGVLGGTSQAVDLTVSFEVMADSYRPTNEDLALEAAGGPPAYGFSVRPEGEHAISLSWIMPESAASPAAAPGGQSLGGQSPGGQSLGAQADGRHFKITIRAETPVHGGLGVADLYSTIMSGVDFKNKMDDLNKFLDKVTSKCEGQAASDFRAATDSLANRLFATLLAKYAAQAVGMAIGATGVGVIGIIAIWAVSAVGGEIADAIWERDFKNLKQAAASSEDCKKDDDTTDDWDDRPFPDPDPPNPDKPIADPKFMIDPSGYLYEGVPSERLEGATATVMEKVGDSFVQWQDVWLGQDNPQITDAEGRYAWDVPEGDWMVAYEKEGYLSVTSDVMHIPPPRTDVNIGMVSLSAPVVAEVDARTGGTHIGVTFSKYMKVSTVNGVTLAVYEEGAVPGEDEPLAGSVVAVEPQEDPAHAGVMLAKEFKFVPSAETQMGVGDRFTVVVDGAAQAYSGSPMGADYTATVTIENTPADPGDPGDPGDPQNPGDGGDNGGGSGAGSPATGTTGNPAVNRFVVVASTTQVEAFGGSVVLEFETGTFGSTGSVTVQIAEPLEGSTPPGGESGLIRLSPVYEITANRSQFSQPVLLTIRYDPEMLGGLDPSRIGIYLQDPVDPSKWTFVGGVVDPVNCTVSVWLTHFSKYAVMANDTEFGDMSGHWAKDQVSTLASKGIVGGVGGGMYDPERPVTRAEMAKILVNSLRLDGRRGIELLTPATPTFSDVPVNQWYYSYVETASALGLVTGFEGKFRPDDPVTREEMAALAVRALGVEDKVALLEGRETAYEDNPEFGSWAKKYAVLAKFKGVMQGVAPTRFDPKGHTTRAQAAVIMIRILERLGLLLKTEVFRGKVRYSEVEGPHVELEVTEDGKTVRYVLLPDGGPNGPVADRFDGLVGLELRVLAVRQEGAGIYMSGPVLRVLEIWKMNCPLCPPVE